MLRCCRFRFRTDAVVCGVGKAVEGIVASISRICDGMSFCRTSLPLLDTRTGFRHDVRCELERRDVRRVN